MTKQGDQTPSQFNARSDGAAQVLRGDLQRQGRQVPDSAPVEVGPDGKPPAPPPPEGSYYRRALEAKRTQEGQPSQQQVLGDQPPAGTTEQLMDGSQAPPLSTGQPPPEAPEQLTPNAQKRIQELVDQLRQGDRDKQQAIAEAQQQSQQLQEQLAALQAQHEQMVQANLDHMDPEDRLRVLQRAETTKLLADFKNELLGELQPQLKNLESKEARREMEGLARKYPAFDYQIHGELIDMYRGKNPFSTIEQAYKAVAEGDELTTRDMARANAVPPVVPPKGTNVDGVRYINQPEPQADPNVEVQDEMKRIAELRRSQDPREQKAGMDMLFGNIAKRLTR